MTEQSAAVCQSCKAEFTTTTDDLKFYQKIDVPSPTWCPECRLQRRMAWRNERVLYSRVCDATGETVISGFSPDAPFPVYKQDYWYSDAWDPLEFGREYDQSRPFFEQFAALSNMVPRPHSFLVNSENCDYTNYTVTSKDCYLCFTALGGNEQCRYSSYLTKSIDCVDCHLISGCELCYECVNCQDSYGLKYSSNSSDCRDSWFLIDCKRCSDCVGCVNLTGKQYCIFNVQYTKEEYDHRVSELALEKLSGIAALREQVQAFSLKFPKKYFHGTNNSEVSGDYLDGCSNCHDSYLSNGNEDARFVFYTWNLKDSFDVFISPLANELIYESHAIPNGNYRLRFCDTCPNGNKDLEYCIRCEASSYLFGCIGLRNKQYCILNKQYTQDEYEALVPKIREQMKTVPLTDALGRVYRYGEFFPFELSPYAYNESVAADYFPHSRAEIEKAGLRWTEGATHKQPPQITVSTKKIPETIPEVDDVLLRETLECANARSGACAGAGAFRVLPQDLAFYRKMNVPIPKLCPQCRQLARLKQRNSLQLHERQCDCQGTQSVTRAHQYTNQIAAHPSHESGEACPNRFRTTYAAGGSEIVYCESCYQAESA